MSDEVTSRYNFNGFFFGRDGSFNLVIEVKTGEYSYLSQHSMELTPNERQQLITVLINTQEKKAN
jgi:hypothetical protein